MWRVVLLTSLIVTAVGAQDKQSDVEVEVSDVDEDLSLDEEELKVLMAEGEEEEEEKVMDEDETDVSGKDKGDENVSFQVRNGQYLKLNL